MIQLENVRKVYESGDEALDGVSLDVTGSEVVTIIGPSGAGKSTLLRCINRLTEPTDGKIWLDDTELTSLSESGLRGARRDIGMIYQEYGLVERLSVMENVLSGRLGYVGNLAALRRKFPGEDISRAYEVLDRVGMAGHENDRADELSGGQRQRVGIARAILQRPKIMLADEPTSSLDPETSRAVMDLLSKIANDDDIPVLINIHEVELAREYADRIIGLRRGEVVFDGTAEELTNSAEETIYGSATTERTSDGTAGDDSQSDRSSVVDPSATLTN